MADAIAALGAELTQSIVPSNASRKVRVEYGTVTAVNDTTLDVSVNGGEVKGMHASLEAMCANVGDRVVILINGPQCTAISVQSTAGNLSLLAALPDAVADLSEQVSTNALTNEEVMDALAELAQVVSDLVGGSNNG